MGGGTRFSLQQMPKEAPSTLKTLPATKGTQVGILSSWERADTEEMSGQAPLLQVPGTKLGHPESHGAAAKLQRGTLCLRVAQVPRTKVGAGPRLPAGTVGTKPHRPPGRALHSSPLGPARDQLLRGLKAKVVWTFNHPTRLRTRCRGSIGLQSQILTSRAAIKQRP